MSSEASGACAWHCTHVSPTAAKPGSLAHCGVSPSGASQSPSPQVSPSHASGAAPSPLVPSLAPVALSESPALSAWPVVSPGLESPVDDGVPVTLLSSVVLSPLPPVKFAESAELHPYVAHARTTAHHPR